MADEVTSGEVRTRRFDVVRKGYDRKQVESFLALVARQIDVYTAQLADIGESEVSFGIDDPETLARELAQIGGEVGAILESAREAAEGMRSRAADDADALKSETDTAIEQALAEASEESQEMRDAAWVEGSAMLVAAIAEASLILDETERDTLRIRAEAEREAIRYSSDAKRGSEETLGAAETEAEAMVMRAKSESESTVAAANQAAELAQERARALEDRRAELLSELETTRSSMGELEAEIESKKQALEEPEPKLDPDERTHHQPDGGSVRIVSASKVVPFKPVDADSFVAEVEELRKHKAEEQLREDPPTPVSVVADIPTDNRILESVPTPPKSIEPIPPDREPAPAVERDPDPEREPEAQAETEPEPEPEPEVVDRLDTIGSLFAQLKSSQEDTADSGNAPPSLQPTADSPEPAKTAEKRSDDAGGSPDDAPDEPEPDSLIPVQNAALRSIKRLLIELQNDTLEHLRTDKNWAPDEDYTDRFGETFAELAAAITGDIDDGGASAVFATDLFDSVSTAVVGSREAGSGDRAIAAATSRVFRTWRSDEAERRVVSVAAALAGDSVVG